MYYKKILKNHSFCITFEKFFVTSRCRRIESNAEVRLLNVTATPSAEVGAIDVK